MFVDKLDKYFADVDLHILTVGWIEPDYVSFSLVKSNKHFGLSEKMNENETIG